MQKCTQLIYRKQISEHSALLCPHHPSEAGLALRAIQAELLSCNLLGCLVSGSVTVMLLLLAISLQTVSATALAVCPPEAFGQRAPAGQ